jgi:hypothetical protein
MKEYRNKLGYLNREDVPSIEYSDGLRHRTDGPAIESNSGYKTWYINGKLHREDGPAIEYSDGSKSWYLDGIKYSEEEFHQEIIKLKLKRLVELC